MKKELNYQVLYSDTDSFIDETFHEDVYQALTTRPALKDHFDFSNFAKDHRLFIDSNAKVVLKWKDELAGENLAESVGLRSKLYSLISASGKVLCLVQLVGGNRKCIMFKVSARSRRSESQKMLKMI